MSSGSDSDGRPRAPVFAALLLLAGATAAWCADGSCRESSPQAARAELKEPLPGHYVSLHRRDTRDSIADVMAPGVRGVQIRYTWASMEPQEGEYDFSEILADLDAVQASGGRLVVFLQDKSFGRESPLPAYLEDFALGNRAGGFTAKRWDPLVVERMGRLIAALGKAVDEHPSFEGLALQETALSLDSQVLARAGYSPQRYRDALEKVILGAADALPRSRVFWYMNYLPRGQRMLRLIAIRVAPAGVVMGGPDILPDEEPLQRLVYPLYEEFADRMPLFGSMQYDSYAHERSGPKEDGRFWTLAELFDFAADDLRVDYVFWNHKTWEEPAGSFTFDDALPVIADNPAFGRAGPPNTESAE